MGIPLACLLRRGESADGCLMMQGDLSVVLFVSGKDRFITCRGSGSLEMALGCVQLCMDCGGSFGGCMYSGPQRR